VSTKTWVIASRTNPCLGPYHRLPFGPLGKQPPLDRSHWQDLVDRLRAQVVAYTTDATFQRALSNMLTEILDGPTRTSWDDMSAAAAHTAYHFGASVWGVLDLVDHSDVADRKRRSSRPSLTHCRFARPARWRKP